MTNTLVAGQAHVFSLLDFLAMHNFPIAVLERTVRNSLCGFWSSELRLRRDSSGVLGTWGHKGLRLVVAWNSAVPVPISSEIVRLFMPLTELADDHAMIFTLTTLYYLQDERVLTCHMLTENQH